MTGTTSPPVRWATGKEAFLDSLAIWCFAFVLVLAPLDFLVQFDSMRKSLTLFTMARVWSGIIFIFVCFTLIAALVNGSAAFLINNRGATRVLHRLNVLLAWTFLFSLFSQTAMLWVNKVFHLSPSAAGTSIKILGAEFFLCLCIMVRREDLSGRFVSFTRSCRGVVLVTVLISLAMTGTVLPSMLQKLAHYRSATVPAATAGAKRPNIILVTFDALSAEDMSLYRYGRKTTPNIDAFAQSSYVFTSMLSNGNWTVPSIASISLGTYPLTHRLAYLTPDASAQFREQNLAHLLKNLGYKTAMITGNASNSNPARIGTYADFDVIFSRDSRLVNGLGINALLLDKAHLYDINFSICYINVFSHYLMPYREVLLHLQALFSPSQAKRKWTYEQHHSAKIHFREAARLLQESKEPLFVWCHVWPPHAPYLPSTRHLYTFLKEHVLETEAKQSAALNPSVQKLRDRYDESILSVDEEFGEFIRTLKEQDLLDDALVLVSADHGEVFSASHLGHGGMNLSRPLTHIPLAIRLPGQKAGRVVDSPAEQVDLPPTILDFIGVSPPSWMEGESLRTVLETETVTRKPKFSMNLDEDDFSGPVRYGVVAVVQEGYKLVRNFRRNSFELYDLADVREEVNLADTERERVKWMNQLIEERIAESAKKRELMR